MAKRRRFVPEGPIDASLEERLAPSTFGSIGDWFSSQYNHVKQDLGITHKAPNERRRGDRAIVEGQRHPEQADPPRQPSPGQHRPSCREGEMKYADLK